MVISSLEICEEVVDDWRGDHIANAICVGMAQGLKGNTHTLSYLVEAWATCTAFSRLAHHLRYLALQDISVPASKTVQSSSAADPLLSANIVSK